MLVRRITPIGLALCLQKAGFLPKAHSVWREARPLPGNALAVLHEEFRTGMSWDMDLTPLGLARLYPLYGLINPGASTAAWEHRRLIIPWDIARLDLLSEHPGQPLRCFA